MAQTIRSSAVLGAAKAGLTLTAQLKDDAGTNVAATWSVVEVGAGGNYEATSTDVPDSFTGGAVRFTGTGVDVMDRDGVTLSLIDSGADVEEINDHLTDQHGAGSWQTGTGGGGGGSSGPVTGLQWQRGGGAYRLGDAVKVSFLTYDGTLSPVELDVLPTAQLRRNGVIDGAVTVTVTSLGAGHYNAGFTVPLTYAINDDLEVVPHAEFASGFVSETPYSLGPLDSKAVGQLQDASVTAIAAQVTTDHGSGSYVRNTEPDNAGIAAALANTVTIIATGGPGPWTTGGGGGATVEEIEEHLASLHGAGSWGSLAIVSGDTVIVDQPSTDVIESEYDTMVFVESDGDSVVTDGETPVIESEITDIIVIDSD